MTNASDAATDRATRTPAHSLHETTGTREDFSGPTALVCAGEVYTMRAFGHGDGVRVALATNALRPLLVPKQLTIAGGARPRLRAAIVSPWEPTGDGQALALDVSYSVFAGDYELTVAFADAEMTQVRSLTQTVSLDSPSSFSA